MISDAKLAANRRNAEKSSGPTTPEGKATASRNSLRHGLTAKSIVIFDETEDAFTAFYTDLLESFAPVDAAEAILVERIAAAHWRLRRAWRAEAAAFNQRVPDVLRGQMRDAVYHSERGHMENNPNCDMTQPEILASARTVSEMLTDTELDEKARARYRHAPATLNDLGFWPDPRLSQLARYEAAIERELHRLVADLDRVQQRRRERMAEAAEMERARLDYEAKLAASEREAERIAAEMMEREAKRDREIKGHPMENVIRDTRNWGSPASPERGKAQNENEPTEPAAPAKAGTQGER